MAGRHSGAALLCGTGLVIGIFGWMTSCPPGRLEPRLSSILPEKPEGSYLLNKLEGTDIVGGRMPLAGDPVSDSTLRVVRQWIEGGPHDN